MVGREEDGGVCEWGSLEDGLLGEGLVGVEGCGAGFEEEDEVGPLD